MQVLGIFSFLFLLGCQNGGSKEVFPAQPGFNVKGSDKKAIELADKMMEALGGYEAFQNTRYFGWTFFGQIKPHGRDRLQLLAIVKAHAVRPGYSFAGPPAGDIRTGQLSRDRAQLDPDGQRPRDDIQEAPCCDAPGHGHR